MALSINEVQNMNLDTLANAIGVCKKQEAANKEKQPSTAEKYKKLNVAFTNAQKKLTNIIDGLKKIEDPSTPVDPATGKRQSYYDTIVAGKEANVTIAYIASKLADKGATVSVDDADKEKIDDSAMDVSSISVRRNFVDMGKDLVSDTMHGKGRAIGLKHALLGYGVAELATTGITSMLAKKGIMSGSVTLFGLAKQGIMNLPTFLPQVAATLTPILSANPIGFTVLGAAAAMALIPMIKRKVDAWKDKFNKNQNAQINFDAVLQKKIAENDEILNPPTP